MKLAAFALAFAVLLVAAPSALAARRLQQVSAELISATVAPASSISTLPAFNSIPEFAEEVPEFSTFELVLNQTGLIDVVSDPDVAVTVFAPTNAAFDEFLAVHKLTLQDLFDSDVVIPILMYHIVPDVVSTSMMSIGQELPTMLTSSNLTVAATTHANSVFKILSENPDSSANIIANKDNILAGQSIIQAVDAVLYPPMPAIEAVVAGTDTTA